MDEELFLENKSARLSRNISEHLGISKNEAQSKLEYAVSSGGFFPESYQAWYQEIGNQKALLSGRLHAAICGLTQGVPTVLSSWDIRTREIVDYFKIPSASGEQIRKEGSLSAFMNADFEGFNERQNVCWGRWSEFLNQNNIANNSKVYDSSVGPFWNFKTELQNDNEILKTASYLKSENKSGQSRQINRALRVLKRGLKSTVRKTRL
ncbi:hypothetical protein AU15_01145 [Marinobacter salarius]|uniref:Uncharacterized protein n=1 Tax=Marinobacter salarius TaxID=1420917 RepID=W5YUR4_9GAMM|nr:hypothetical protein AU15_01145 [Marinobacter salarius]